MKRSINKVRTRQSRSLLITTALLGGAFVFNGCFGGEKKQVRVADPTGIREFAEEAKQLASHTSTSTGSLWTNSGQHSNLFRDMKARYINDVVTIQVSESTQATASADASSSRSADVSSGIEQLYGLQGRIKELPGLAAGATKNTFDGKGETTRASQLQTTLTARVIDVLPNGYLVVEGKREIKVNNENQTVTLAGIVRPNDINMSNIVQSSSVAQMTVRVQGKGAVSQPLKPGWLYQILNGILPF